MKASKMIEIAKAVLRARDIEGKLDRELLKWLTEMKAKETKTEGTDTKVAKEIVRRMSENMENIEEEEVEKMKQSFSKFLDEDKYFASIVHAIIDIVTDEECGEPGKIYG